MSTNTTNLDDNKLWAKSVDDLVRIINQGGQKKKFNKKKKKEKASKNQVIVVQPEFGTNFLFEMPGEDTVKYNLMTEAYIQQLCNLMTEANSKKVSTLYRNPY